MLLELFAIMQLLCHVNDLNNVKIQFCNIHINAYGRKGRLIYIITMQAYKKLANNLKFKR